MNLDTCGEQLAGGLPAVLEQPFAMGAHKKQRSVCKTYYDMIDAFRISWLYWGRIL